MSRSDVFWGVDFSCRAASIGWASGGDRGVITATWDESLRGGERLQTAYSSVGLTARALSLVHPAVFVYVEQPSGSYDNPELSYMAGIIQATIFGALFEHWKKPVEIRTVTSGEWKKEVLGRGDYRKPKKNEDFEYEGIKWCRERDIEVADDNEGDAVCIAEYANRVVSFVQ